MRRLVPGKMVWVSLSSSMSAWSARSQQSLPRPSKRTRRTALSGSGRISASDVMTADNSFSGVGLFSLHLCDRRNHAGFSTIGDHADDVEQQPLPGRNHVESVVVVQVGGKNVHRQIAGIVPCAVGSAVRGFRSGPAARLFCGRISIGWQPGCAGCRGGFLIS